MDKQIVVASFSNTLATPTPCARPFLKSKPEYDFCYVADGQPHKNHYALFAALRILAQDGVFPNVAVTLEKNEVALLDQLSELQSAYRVRVDNVGKLSHEAVLYLYSNSWAHIYPSLLESFGLPLIEASSAGLPIVAGELNFVRDVCCAVETFDPTAPRSIARAMKRFLKLTTQPPPIMNASEFVDQWQKMER